MGVLRQSAHSRLTVGLHVRSLPCLKLVSNVARFVRAANAVCWAKKGKWAAGGDRTRCLQAYHQESRELNGTPIG